MSSVDFDLGLFETISSLIQEQREATRPNRRDGERHPFPCAQLLAGFDGVHLPGTEQLRVVQCHDLSPRGFSYYANDPPETNQVIVGLGNIPFQFFVAEVMHAQPTYSSNGPMYQVGCRFLRRLSAG